MAPQPHVRPHRLSLLGIRSHVSREPQWDFGTRAVQEYQDLHNSKEHGGRPHTYGGVDVHKSISYSFSAPNLAGSGNVGGTGVSGSPLARSPDPGSYILDDKHTSKRPPAFGFGSTARGGGIDPYGTNGGHGPGPAAYDCRASGGGGLGSGAKYSMKGRGNAGRRGEPTPAPGDYGDLSKRGGSGPKWGSPQGSGGLGAGGASGGGLSWAPGPDYMPRGLGGGGFSMGTAPLPSKKAVQLARTLPPTYTLFGHHGK